MKQSFQLLPLAMLLAAYANAQSTSPASTTTAMGTTTNFYSICPTATSTTITLSTTTTICPGPNCGGTTTVFYDPVAVTTVGADGETTVLEYLPYTAPCPCAGGVCDAVYTITRPCPCTGAPPTLTTIPSGFTTTAMACEECAMNGGPSTVVFVMPCSTGPYASQTPSMGAPYNGAYASAGATAYAYASAGSNDAVASAGANAVASAGNAYASAGASAYASAPWNNGSAPAGAEASANAGSNDIEAPSAASTPAMNMTSISSPTLTPMATYTGSANRAAYAIAAIAVGIAGGLAVLF